MKISYPNLEFLEDMGIHPRTNLPKDEYRMEQCLDLEAQELAMQIADCMEEADDILEMMEY